jgi:molecular chaperone GrpE (heat shock protein)
MLDPEVRRTILARVEAALDLLETGQSPPEGIAAALLENADVPPPDLYALLAQMTALTREVQLQGRAANRLSTEVTQLVQQVSASSEGQISARTSAARREAQTDLLGEILDVRERFARGLEEARKRLDSFRGLFARLGSHPVVEALLRGNELALERLDETLRRYGVHEIACEGEEFDPNTMRAVEHDVRTDVRPGMVIEVLRRGYRTAERILRYAEVNVSSVGRPADAGEKRQ